MGQLIIIIILLVVIPVGFLMSMAVVAALLGEGLRKGFGWKVVNKDNTKDIKPDKSDEQAQ